LAEEIGVSKQAVFKRINNEPLKSVISDMDSGIVISERNKIYLSDQACDMVKEAFAEKFSVKKFNVTSANEVDAARPSAFNIDMYIQDLRNHIDLLRHQLQVKDDQIKAKDNQIKEFQLQIKEISNASKPQQKPDNPVIKKRSYGKFDNLVYVEPIKAATISTYEDSFNLPFAEKLPKVHEKKPPTTKKGFRGLIGIFS